MAISRQERLKAAQALLALVKGQNGVQQAADAQGLSAQQLGLAHEQIGGDPSKPVLNRLSKSQMLLGLAKLGRAHTVIEDYKRNTTGGKRAGQAYQTVLTDGGNVLHRYTNGDSVFVRKQPAAQHSPGDLQVPVSQLTGGHMAPGTSFDDSGSGMSYRMPDPHGPSHPKVPPIVTDDGQGMTTITAPQGAHMPPHATDIGTAVGLLLAARRRRKQPPTIALGG